MTGLAIGLSFCFFVFQYLGFELSYDKFNSKYHKIYRLVTNVQTSNGIDYQSSTEPMAAAIRADFPEVKEVTHIFLDYFLVQRDEKNFGEEKVAYADSSFFSVFNYPLLSGNVQTALSAPFDFILSESTAKKYFGKTNVVGESLIVNGKNPVRITGVMKDMPANSHLHVDIIASMSTLLKGFNPSIDGNWNYFGFYSYLVLDNKEKAAALEKKLSGFMLKYNDSLSSKYRLILEPLADVYLRAKARGSRTGSSETGNIRNVYIFLIVALFVLLISIINFINLSTAFSLERAKEIGVRKVLGASRSQLFRQFLLDAILLATIAFFLAFVLCLLLKPLFNEIAGKTIGMEAFINYRYIILLWIVATLTGILSGLYPAFFLSGFNPIKILKGRFVQQAHGISIRKSLVVVQFAVSMIVIISTIVVYHQLHYMQSKELGFKKDHMLVIDYQFDERITVPHEMVRQQLSTIPGVTATSFSSTVPGRANRKMLTKMEDKMGQMLELRWDSYSIDYEFLEQYEVSIVAGRKFSREYPSDSIDGILVNEIAARGLGYKNASEIIGKKYFMSGKEGRVLGVFKDFHFHSFHEEIQPLTMNINPGRYTFISLSFSSQNIQTTVNKIENKWRELAPGLPLSFFFADEAYNAQYVAEARFGKLIAYFGFIAIFLSSLGLLALSAYSISQRTKEIGIRKILGATEINILSRLFADSLMPVFTAMVFAFPIAWFAMHQWLENYPYRVEMKTWMFLAAGIIGIIISIFSVGFHVFKAAVSNPVDTLRNQ